MSDLISLLVPTRGRPAGLAAMWQSALETADHPDMMELLVFVDDDDEITRKSALFTSPDPAISVVVQARRLLSETWNELAQIARGGILWHGNDDVLFRSAGWDTYIRGGFERFPDRIACVHGRDGIHDGDMATLGFYSREWMNALGYFVPPYFSSDYNDTWLSEVADKTNRRVFMTEVYTEHMHPAVGKGSYDQTHEDRLTRHRQDNVDVLYRELAHLRDIDAQKIRDAITAGATVR